MITKLSINFTKMMISSCTWLQRCDKETIGELKDREKTIRPPELSEEKVT